MTKINTKATVHAKHIVSVNETLSPTRVIVSYTPTKIFTKTFLGVCKRILLILEGFMIPIQAALMKYIVRKIRLTYIYFLYVYPLGGYFNFLHTRSRSLLGGGMRDFYMAILYCLAYYDYDSCWNIFNLLHELIDKTCDGPVITDSLVIDGKHHLIRLDVSSDTNLLELSKDNTKGSSIAPDSSPAQKYHQWVILGFLISSWVLYFM